MPFCFDNESVVLLLKLTTEVVAAHLHKLSSTVFASGHIQIMSKQSL